MVNIRDNRKLWDKILADTKEKMPIDIDTRGDRTVDVLLRNLLLKKGQTVLELGAGTGFNTLLCSKMFGVESFLLDFSEGSAELVKILRKRLNVNCHFILGDCRHLPFHLGSFDIVWSSGVNEHFLGRDRQEVFDEMSRVCKPCGYVLVTVPNALNPFYVMRKKILELKQSWPFGFEKPYTQRELRRRIENGGLEFLRFDGFGFLRSVADFVQLLLSQKIKGFRKGGVDNGILHKLNYGITHKLGGLNRARLINMRLGLLIVGVARKNRAIDKVPNSIPT